MRHIRLNPETDSTPSAALRQSQLVLSPKALMLLSINALLQLNTWFLTLVEIGNVC